MKKMTSKVSVIVSGFIVCSLAALAMNVQAVLNGAILDSVSNKPVEVSYVIKDVNSDTEIQGKAANGVYQAVLEAGKTYDMTMWSFNTWRQTETFTMRASNDYYEEKKNFSVLVLDKGVELFAWNLFDGGGSNLSAKGKASFKEFLDDMKMNRAVYVDVIASSAAQQKALEALVDGARRAVKKRINVTTGSTGKNQVVVKVTKVKKPF